MIESKTVVIMSVEINSITFVGRFCIEELSHSYFAHISYRFLAPHRGTPIVRTIYQGIRIHFRSRCKGTSWPASIRFIGCHWSRCVPAHWLALSKIRPSRQHRYARPPSLIRPAWKLSRLWRTSMCLTELSRAYDLPLKGPDTAKTYRFHGNSKPAFSVRCDFMLPDVACWLQFRISSLFSPSFLFPFGIRGVWRTD